ncbi:MAG: AAA family ATPase [Methylobacteriaceae bacterium]|nr:AAA family ATPase [Methylobacteriaceae bacterium]
MFKVSCVPDNLQNRFPEMRTIAFVTQKGGSGKSTLASCVAVAAHEAGERVFVIDMDPLASLINWSKARGEQDIAVEAVPAGKLKAVLAALEKKGVTLAVIDTPGADDAAMMAAVKNADLCIVPARPNAFDLWASEKTRKAVKSAGRDYAFLLNQCPPSQQSARVELGVKTLETLGGMLSPLVSARVDFQEAARQGWGVTEIAPSGSAADEIRTLWSSIKRRLNKSVAQRNVAAAGKAKKAA